MRRARAFLAGVSVGAVLASNWRPLAKGAVKTGIRGGAAVRAGASRAAENLADVVEEATAEMSDGMGEPAPTTTGVAARRKANVNGGRNGNGKGPAGARKSTSLT